jgi:hypothetical protein
MIHRGAQFTPNLRHVNKFNENISRYGFIVQVVLERWAEIGTTESIGPVGCRTTGATGQYLALAVLK